MDGGLFVVCGPWTGLSILFGEGLEMWRVGPDDSSCVTFQFAVVICVECITRAWGATTQRMLQLYGRGDRAAWFPVCVARQIFAVPRGPVARRHTIQASQMVGSVKQNAAPWLYCRTAAEGQVQVLET